MGRVWALRGPFVYRALTTLQAKGMVEVIGAEHSDVGPPRTLMSATCEGRERLAAWLRQPVRHLRDVRSELMLKLVLLDRWGGDRAPLLDVQRPVFEALVAALERRCAESDGFDRTLMRWRLESARAALRFLDDSRAERGRGWSRRADSNR